MADRGGDGMMPEMDETELDLKLSGEPEEDEDPDEESLDGRYEGEEPEEDFPDDPERDEEDEEGGRSSFGRVSASVPSGADEGFYDREEPVPDDYPEEEFTGAGEYPGEPESGEYAGESESGGWAGGPETEEYTGSPESGEYPGEPDAGGDAEPEDYLPPAGMPEVRRESSIFHTLPCDRQAERSIIGSMLMDPDAISDVSGIIGKEDFFDAQYGLLFEAIQSLHQEGRSIDEVILADRLRSLGAPETLTRMDYLGDILADQQTSVFAVEYAKIVREKSLLRTMIRTAEGIAKNCYEGQGTVESIFDNAEEDIFKVVQSKSRGKDFDPMQSIVVNVIQEIEEASRKDGRVNGIATGFYDLDRMLTGMHKGELILVGARPSMGKTAFVLNIAHHVLIREKVPTAFFTLEMSQESLVSRMIAMDARVDSQNIRTGNLSDDEWDKILLSTETMAKVPLFIIDNSSVTVPELRSICRKLKRTQNLGLIIIDYLQLMNPSHRVESRQLFIAEVSRALKGLARELELPIIALSQLSRAVDSRPDHRPVLADLRESGSIEQDADVVMFIYRDEKYNPETENPGVAEIIIAKQRSGAIGTVELIWQGEYTRFVNKAK